MEVLRPQTVWIGDRCYRVLTPNTNLHPTTYAEPDMYGNEEAAYQDELDCADETDFTVEEMSNGKMQTAFHVPNLYIPYLIGSKGVTKIRIERDTHTSIKFPGKGQDGDVVVVGGGLRAVRQARLRLEMLVGQARARQPSTHFLSIPLNTSSIQQKFTDFKREVLERCGDSRGVDESLFQQEGRLHLTLAVLTLADSSERQQAVETLEKCRETVITKQLGSEPLRVEVKGIDYMNDDLREVDVLYGRVNALSWSHSLQTIVDSVVGEFVKVGLVSREQEHVKLHMTLMNTTFRRRTKQGQGQGEEEEESRTRERETFCAEKIIKEFGEYDFGVMDIDELHLSIRHTSNASKYYSASGKLNLRPE